MRVRARVLQWRSLCQVARMCLCTNHFFPPGICSFTSANDCAPPASLVYLTTLPPSSASGPEALPALYFNPAAYRFTLSPPLENSAVLQGSVSEALDISLFEPPTRSEIVGGEIASALWPSEVVLSRMLWESGSGGHLLRGCTVLELGAGSYAFSSTESFALHHSPGTNLFLQNTH